MLAATLVLTGMDQRPWACRRPGRLTDGQASWPPVCHPHSRHRMGCMLYAPLKGAHTLHTYTPMRRSALSRDVCRCMRHTRIH